MKIESPTVVIDEGYPFLELRIDGKPYKINAEQKPTLIRHGIVAVEGPFRATLPGGREVKGSDDPRLFRWVAAFLLDCYHNRIEDGQAQRPDIDTQEFFEMGVRLNDYALPGADSWDTITANTLGLRV